MHRRTAVVLTLLLAATLIRCAPSGSEDEPVPADTRGAQPLTAAGALKIMSYNIKHAELSSADSIANVIRGQSRHITRRTAASRAIPAASRTLSRAAT